MKAVLTNKYQGRKFKIINNYETGLAEGQVVIILNCISFADGDACFNVSHPKVEGVMLSWLEDSTIMMEVK